MRKLTSDVVASVSDIVEPGTLGAGMSISGAPFYCFKGYWNWLEG